MLTLVLNSGSSSLKYQVFSGAQRIFKGHIEEIGIRRCRSIVEHDGKKISASCRIDDHASALHHALVTLKLYKIISNYTDIERVGHRVVHGGEKYIKPTKIDRKVIDDIQNLSKIAPLHNPHNLAGILACKKLLPAATQVAVFDTAFHSTIPKKAFMYGLPENIYHKYKIRKYGFHGTSHKYVSKQAIKLLGKRDSRIITCHLGNGSSVTAVKNGKSIDTSMGFSPLDGLTMGTRAGHLDPEVILFLLRQGYTEQDLHEMLNKKSGFYGLTHGCTDMRDLLACAEGKTSKVHSRATPSEARFVIDMLSYEIVKFIGSYTAVLNGIDAIVFTAGIGENVWQIRKKVCDQLTFLGMKLSYEKNKKNSQEISTPASKVKVFVIPTDEEKEIVEEIARIQ
ncbi:acetate kinase [Candidatus Woesearchaeota archaeon]|nr:acetate kinase [Candidatus Woesearchaeota archaeon]